MSELEARAAQHQAKVSRIDAMIAASMVRMEPQSKRLMDTLRVTVRKLFHRALEPFKKAYDNYRDDHDYFRQLTRSSAVLEMGTERVTVHLMPKVNYSPQMQRIIGGLLEQVNQQGPALDVVSIIMLKKYREGPVGHIVLAPTGAPNMGKHLGLWFLWTLVIAAVAAFLATRLLGLDHSHARAAAKLVGAVTFIAHGFGTMQESIWTARPWSSSAKYLLDAALYAAGSGFVFFWLWP